MKVFDVMYKVNMDFKDKLSLKTGQTPCTSCFYGYSCVLKSSVEHVV